MGSVERKLGADEMAQWVRSTSMRTRAHIPSAYLRELGVAKHACNSSAGAETDRFLDLMCRRRAAYYEGNNPNVVQMIEKSTDAG